MKILSAGFSNILSFEETEDIEEIHFMRGEDLLSINIGPNGSGKTNMLETLNYLFTRIWFQSYSFDEGAIQKLESTSPPQKSSILKSAQPSKDLPTNWNSASKNQEIRITIEFSERELDEIKNFINVLQSIRACSTITNSFDDLLKINVPTSVANIVAQNGFTYSRSEPTQAFTLKGGSELQKFLDTYLKEFEKVTKAITMLEYFGERGLIDVDSLQTPTMSFLIMPSGRGSLNIPREINLGGSSFTYLNQNSGQTLSFKKEAADNRSKIIQNTLREFCDQHYRWTDQHGIDAANEKILQDEQFSEVNEALNEYLGLSIELEKDRSKYGGHYRIRIKDSENREISIPTLSSGEQSIMGFIFTLYSKEISGGFLLVDEPEIHLHVQLQQKFINLLITRSSKKDVQTILVTHSPAMIDKESISRTNRFGGPRGRSKIYFKENFTTLEKNLVRFLNYTNNSKLFFANKVILVEGETDQYFFRAYLDEYINQLGVVNDQVIEIVDMGGKGMFLSWTKFLEELNIKHFFIGDLDNIAEFHIGKDYLNQVTSVIDNNVAASRKFLKENSLDKGSLFDLIDQYKDSLDGDTLDLIVAIKTAYIDRKSISEKIRHLVERKGEEFQKIMDEIKSKYEQGIFILKYGDLENYLRKPKGLIHVIDFCNSELPGCLLDPNEHFQELKEIFNRIYGSESG